jgi:hypothetical protein
MKKSIVAVVCLLVSVMSFSGICFAGGGINFDSRLAYQPPAGYEPIPLCPEISPDPDGRTFDKDGHWGDAVSGYLYVEVILYVSEPRVKAKEVVCSADECEQYNRSDARGKTRAEDGLNKIQRRYKRLGYDIVLIPVVEYGPDGDGGRVSTLGIYQAFWRKK